jgi:hypothetical protein
LFCHPFNNGRLRFQHLRNSDYLLARLVNRGPAACPNTCEDCGAIGRSLLRFDDFHRTAINIGLDLTP